MMMITLLKAAAALQLVIAVLNLNLVTILKWRDHLPAIPLLMKQVFNVHLWFISVTLAIFATLTWRFAPDFAEKNNALARWFCGGLTGFWLLRLILQMAYYSPSHWSGKRAATAVHVALLVVYSGFVMVYGRCCLGG